jgi:hypothetical protein
MLGLVPVQNAPRKRGNQPSAGLRTGHGLYAGEKVVSTSSSKRVNHNLNTEKNKVKCTFLLQTRDTVTEVFTCGLLFVR